MSVFLMFQSIFCLCIEKSNFLQLEITCLGQFSLSIAETFVRCFRFSTGIDEICLSKSVPSKFVYVVFLFFLIAV